MLELRRIIQLSENGFSNRNISRKLRLARDTVNSYVNRFKSSGKTNGELLKLTDEQLGLLVFEPKSEAVPTDKYTDLMNRMEYFSNELKKSKTTKQILWEEYRVEVPDGYSRSQFCDYLSRYLESRKAVMHFEHEPGALMEFDFAGDPLYYVDVLTGEFVKCPVLVCRLPCSNYSYVEALPSQKREHLIAALGRALSYYGGVPAMVKTDNMRQFVTKADRYEPSFDVLAEQWALHYNTTLGAARVRKPRDKASVESGVNTTYYRIYAPLRNRICHNLNELNAAILQENEKLNRSNLQGQDYSRYDKFFSLEQPTLRPLAQTPFVIKNSQSTKVRHNYHVKLSEDVHYYSVPFKYIAQQTTIIYDTDNVEIYINNYHRIASHKRDYRKNGYTTVPEHMPSSHVKYSEQKNWTYEHYLTQAASIGENTLAAIKKIMKNKGILEQNYESSKGTLALAKKYGNDRLEAACGRALQGSKINSAILKNILSRNLDKVAIQITLEFNIPEHTNLRGPEAYN
jgi:transposase